MLNTSGNSVTHDLYPEITSSNKILSYTVKPAYKGNVSGRNSSLPERFSLRQALHFRILGTVKIFR